MIKEYANTVDEVKQRYPNAVAAIRRDGISCIYSGNPILRSSMPLGNGSTETEAWDNALEMIIEQENKGY